MNHRSSSSLISGIPALLVLLALPGKAVDFVRQVQLIKNQTVVYDIPVTGTSGQVLSKPLEGDGAILQLYAFEDDKYNPFSLVDLNAGNLVHANVSLDSHLLDLDVLGIHLDIILGGSGDPPPVAKLLDEVAIGTYLPEAKVTLRSEDPYQPPRTRADKPYSFSLSARKLADPADPRGGISKMRVDRDFKLYHPQLHTPYPNGVGQGSYSQSYEFQRNGDFTDSSVYQELPYARPTKAIGEETFTAKVPVGSSGTLMSIGSATIQVWPVSEATVENIVADQRYTAIPPSARVVFKDLYPDSVTYAQIYEGPPVLGKVGKVIGSSVVSYNTFEPQDAVVPLSIADSDLGGDGTYTIEVLTTTPFNERKPERVTYVSFVLDRTIEVHGQLVGGEN